MKHLNRKPDITSKISTLIAQHIEQIRTLEEERPRFVYPFVTEVYKELHVESAHLLPNHNAKCKYLHGHSYRVGITVRGQLWDGIGDTTEGMVMDFKELKAILKAEVDEKFDHEYLNQVMNIGVRSKDFRDYREMSVRSTAEQMAWFIFVTLYEYFEMEYKSKFNEYHPSMITKYPFEIVQVDVWETTTSKATAKREYFDYETYQHNLYASAYADDDVKSEPVEEVFSAEPADDDDDWDDVMPEPEVEEAPSVSTEPVPEEAYEEAEAEPEIEEEVEDKEAYDRAMMNKLNRSEEKMPKKRAPKK